MHIPTYWGPQVNEISKTQATKEIKGLTKIVREWNNTNHRATRNYIRSVWSDGFRLFRSTYLLTQAIGMLALDYRPEQHDPSSCGKHRSSIPSASCRHLIRFNTLCALLNQACQSSQVIDQVMRAGYWIESAAPLRGLYETMITALAIEADVEGEIACRYYDSCAIREYQLCDYRRGWDGAPEEWFPLTEKERISIAERAGKVASHWGWQEKKNVGYYEWARPIAINRTKEGKNKPMGSVRIENIAIAVGKEEESRHLHNILSQSVHVSPLQVLTRWEGQSRVAGSFVPVSNETTLQVIPDILLTASGMLADISLASAKLCEQTTPETDLMKVHCQIVNCVKLLEHEVGKVCRAAQDTFS